MCIGKASYKREISQKQVELVRQFVRSEFSVENPEYPCGLCNSCHSKLYKKARDPESELDIEPFTPQKSINLRSQSTCTCRICDVAKVNGFESKTLTKKRGRPCSKPESQSVGTPITVCDKCLTKLYPGCNHECNRSTKLENIESYLLSPTKSTSAKLFKRQKQEAAVPKPVSISAENLSTIGINMNMSVRKSRELAQQIRQAAGSRSIIEKGAQAQIRDDRHVLDDHFQCENLLFLEENTKTKEKRKFFEHTIICKDVNHLISEIIRHRHPESCSVMIRLGLDGGRGFLKFCLNVFNVDDPVSKCSEIAKKFKDSGVKKALILAISQGVQENYQNLKKMWIKLGLRSMAYPFTIATDMKLINILLGMQNHLSLIHI